MSQKIILLSWPPHSSLSQVRSWCLLGNQLSRLSQTTWTERWRCSTLPQRPDCTRCTSNTTERTSQVSVRTRRTRCMCQGRKRCQRKWFVCGVDDTSTTSTMCELLLISGFVFSPGFSFFTICYCQIQTGSFFQETVNHYCNISFCGSCFDAHYSTYAFGVCVPVCVQSPHSSSMWTMPAAPVSQPTVPVWATASPTRRPRSLCSQTTPPKVQSHWKPPDFGFPSNKVTMFDSNMQTLWKAVKSFRILLSYSFISLFLRDKSMSIHYSYSL